MTTNTPNKTIFNNKNKIVNSELFDEIRLSKGLSRFKLALEAEMSPQTVGRVLSGGDPRPSTVKKLGEVLGIPPNKWYINKERK